MVDWDLGINRH